MRTWAIVLGVLFAGVSTARANEDKYLRIEFDNDFALMASAEGYSTAAHVTRSLEPLRRYLSRGDLFWITFGKGLIFSPWAPPRDGSSPGDFLGNLKNDCHAGNDTPWALVVGVTGRYNDDGVLLVTETPGGWGWWRRFPRHSVLFYRHLKRQAADDPRVDRFQVTRACAAIGIGRNYGEGGYHDDRTAAVPQSDRCAMNRGQALHQGVYWYCGNHDSKFFNYQKSKGRDW